MSDPIETIPRRHTGTFAEGMSRVFHTSERIGTFATGIGDSTPEKALDGSFAAGMKHVDQGGGSHEGTFAEGQASCVSETVVVAGTIVPSGTRDLAVSRPSSRQRSALLE